MDITNNKLPNTAIIAITNRCNSRCSFCNIWKIKSGIDLDTSLIDFLPSSLKRIDITGGEPFLHEDIVAIVERLISKNCEKISINTNGLIDLKKFSGLWKMGDVLGIRFSLDGTEKVHDELRGVKGNFDKVLAQIEYLKALGLNDIGISSTFSDDNVEHMRPLYDLSVKMKISFTCMVVGNSGVYYKKKDNIIKNKGLFRKNLKAIKIREATRFSLRSIGKAIYLNGLIEYINNDIKRLRCPAGAYFFFMQPDGKIYSCNMRNFYMGDLSKNSFNQIWNSKRAGSLRKAASYCNKPCWTMCNAKNIIMNSKIKYFLKLFS